MAKLSVNIIVYHQKEVPYFAPLFASLAAQTFQDFSLVLIDNTDGDGTFDLLHTEAKKLGRDITLVHNDGNVGFANGHNAGIKASNAEYILLQNPDMYLTPEVFEHMVAFLDAHDTVAAVSPRLMRWDFARVTEAADPDAGKTNQIDCIGVRLFRNRRAVEWLTRQVWDPSSDSPDVQALYGKKAIEVFGVSGAFPMYRASVLKAVAFSSGDVFDPLYHSYKEDLDLAYRMRNLGYTSYVLLNTIAYHDRTGAGPKELSDMAAALNKKNQSEYVRYHSYKNHLMTLYKNEYWQNVLRDFPGMFWYEAKKFIFLLLVHPRIFFRAWWYLVAHAGQLRAQRRDVVAKRTLFWKGIRRWFL